MAKIDLSVNRAYIVVDGVIHHIDDLPRGFGEQVITWQNGKPVHTKVTYSKKI
ncbi:DUF3954 domain-containing protein [Alkalicoccobacillus porphyridii]|uniref:DUF3954 domain-containing protein n=1 Tax=Alkalicoccobacillus porphyridii TaxID=2597270 RepID=A0A554A0M0_9BACI|nr:DUF3954 domain-containing protein [Alkalicoccobacillus porphyridii]TSB47186.1 DUF3954 domain-containing protein [Alkalicoccobacillus porphyridii]